MSDPIRKYGPCPTRLDNQPTPSVSPWRYGHAASIEGAHWNIYAGEGIDGWLVGMVRTEADAALIVERVNAVLSTTPAPDPTDRPEGQSCGCTCCSGTWVLDAISYRCSGGCRCTARWYEGLEGPRRSTP